MRRALAVDVDREAGIFAHERAGGASVIEMNVGEKDGVEIGDLDAVSAELFAERGERRFRTGIDDGAMIFGIEKRGGDGSRVADPVGVEYCDFVHCVFLRRPKNTHQQSFLTWAKAHRS